ncbi:molybdate ABC transporter substrate-binding protein [Neisseria arctica]|uniref:Molybdate ABC transporter substrate-binding protein n=1 Tax=Neisseria arctica TaxID=1470200 RepID=A0A0J1C5K9_9NEIS|nr:molybdate ABC transporter substrate-binding protein [Neisseria arctica]KLT73608.1 molybdate ABC transporter substrate-binding protein [Neisseria arctica]UOO85730.1 molybdate ABC transporter substrate-binding protein [Neisseria arctica]
MKLHFLILGSALLCCQSSVWAAEITVSAAASLSNAFKDIAGQYQKRYPDTVIRLNTAGSGTLLQQAIRGAPVDVLAFADDETMDKAQAAGIVDKAARKIFARNTLVLVVPVKSRLNIRSINDLPSPDVRRIALSNPASVPAGRYGKAALERSGQWQKVLPKIIQTQHVRQSLDYVARGEVDAGFVYRTDAALMPGKVKIAATVQTDKTVSYPAAVVKDSRQATEARRFTDYLASVEAQNILRKYGFGKP